MNDRSCRLVAVPWLALNQVADLELYLPLCSTRSQLGNPTLKLSGLRNAFLYNRLLDHWSVWLIGSILRPVFSIVQWTTILFNLSTCRTLILLFRGCLVTRHCTCWSLSPWFLTLGYIALRRTRKHWFVTIDKPGTAQDRPCGCHLH